MDGWMDQTAPSHNDNSDHDGVAVTSWVSVCPKGLWNVLKKPTDKKSQQMVSNSIDAASSSPSYYPRLGSLCRVRVRLKSDTGNSETSECETGIEELSFEHDKSVTEVVPRCKDSVLQVPLGEWTTLRLGEGQCDITEACVEGMRAGEKCEILISPLKNRADVSVPHPADDDPPLRATVELKAFTAGKESWEVSPVEKWEWVKSHKGRGGERFRSGDVWGAADSYSRALKLLITLYGHIRDKRKNGHKCETEEERDTDASDKTQGLPSDNEFNTTKAELHSNLSLCQLKLKQPGRAKASAAKATQLEPGGAKAWYRLGQACQMVNELEEARQAFKKLLEIQPDSPAALKALKDVASKEKETNAQLGLRLSKMFS